MSESGSGLSAGADSPSSIDTRRHSADSLADLDVPLADQSSLTLSQMVAANAVAAAAINRLNSGSGGASAAVEAKKGGLLQLQLVNENGSITPIEVVTSMAAAAMQVAAAKHLVAKQESHNEVSNIFCNKYSCNLL